MSQSEITQFGVTPNGGLPRIQLRIKPHAIREFYCRICEHQYTLASHTNLNQHITTLYHMQKLLKRQGCLLD
jgi:hypothetical protein